VPLIALLGLVMQAPKTPAAPDRSGEGELRKILVWAKSLDNVHVIILKASRESSVTPMYPDSRIDVWLAGPRFRVETSDGWGGGSELISDGSTVLSDSHSEWEAAIVSKAKGSLLATYDDLKVKTDDMSPFFGLLGGSGQLDKLADKGTAIRQEPDHGGEKVVSIAHKKLGAERFFYHEEKGSPVLDRIEFDNIPATLDLYREHPEWEADPPDPGSLTRHEILIERQRPNDSLFVTTPPKGREVKDERKKKVGWVPSLAA
jgi:hypothetical protein